MKKNISKPFTVFAIFCLLFLISCNNNPQQSSQIPHIENDNSAYDEVMKSKTIRVGYISYPPSFIKDANSGKLSGIFYDVLMEMGRNMNLKIEFVEEVNWGTMITEVNSGKIDLVCTGIWPTSDRALLADFTNPIYFSPVKAYVKFGNTNFDGNLLKINSEKVKISAIDGEMTSKIAKYDFPLAQISSLTQSSDVSQVLLDIASGKAEVTFVEPAQAKQYLKNNPNSIQEVANVKPLRVNPNVMMTAKGEYKLLSMLNVSIDELSNRGFIDKVVDKYEQFPNSFYRRQSPYIIN